MRALTIACVVAAVAAHAACGDKARDGGRGENLIANSDFSEPIKRPWSVVPGVVRKETAALSGDWVLSALGKNYFIINYMDDPNLKWEAGEEFTIVIDARSCGKGSNLAIIHRYTKPDGSVGEGTYRRLELSNEWHEYYVPTVATKAGPPRGFSFFKTDSGEHDTGVEIRSFKMYRGRISSLDIRRIVRAGRAYVQKGTEIPVAPNMYGVAARPLRALVFVRGIQYIREVQHVFAGTGATVHCLSSESRASDTFMTDDDPVEVLRMLKSGGYDLYAFARGAAPNVGAEVFKMVEANVRKGASLYFHPVFDAPKPDYGLFGPVLASLSDGRYGKGRVTAGVVRKTREDERLYDRSRAFMTYPRELTVRMGYEGFPYEDVMFAEMAETMYRAAFGAANAPGGARTDRSEKVYAGERHVLEWVRTAGGKTVSFSHSAAPADGPVIGAVADTGLEVEVALSNATVSAELKWRFSDFSGRIFGRGSASGPVARLEVPRKKLYTSFGLLELALVDRGRTLDRRNVAVIERDNDRLRMIGDYGAGIWPMKGNYTYTDARDMFLQLKSCGFNYSFMPHAWGTVYPTGFAATSSYVIGGEYFSGSPTAKDNIRSPVFNTPAARRRIREKALRWAAGNLKWGGMYGAFSDEAALGPNGMEVDAHPENIKVYREWMERKYGTIAEYNRRHRTAHKSFEDLGQTLLKDARASGNAAEFIEWRNFNVDRWVEVIREVGDAIKEVDPKVLYSLDNSFGEMSLSGNDYWKLLTRTGLDYSKEYAATTSFGRDPLQEFDALYRSWRPDMRVWGWTGYGFTSDRELALPWMTALHRQGGFHWFAATYYGINLLDLVTGAKTADAAECERSLAASRMLRGLGKTLTDWKWTKNDVAVYYSHDSNIMTYFLGEETLMREMRASTPYGRFQNSRRGLMSLLESVFCQYEFVSQEQVEKGFLDGGDWSVYRCGRVIEGQPPFKVLFMTHIVAMSDREVAAVKAFMKRGGKVVCDILPGEYDELGVKRAKAPFDEGEMTVTGKNFSDLIADQRKWAVKFLHDAGATFAIESPTVVENLEREGVHYRDGGADVYGVLRKPYHGKTAETTDKKADELIFARAGHVYDVREQKYLGRTDRVTAFVPFAEAKVYAVLSEKIDGIVVAGLPADGVKRGSAVSADMQIKSSDLSPAYVLHVDVVPPSGECPAHFQRNFATKGGRAHLDFPIALNDETGAWTLRVSEPLTGVSAELAFRVK